MFCPNCGVEYRPGFHECSDCHVALVERLPQNAAADEAQATNAQGQELLWSGVQPGPFSQIVDALNEAGVAHLATSKNWGLPGFAQQADFIWVDPRHRSRAEAALAAALAETADKEEPTQDVPTNAAGKSNNEDAVFEFGSPNECTPDDIVEDFDPDQATVEVWAGNSEDMAETFKQCLNGVGIGCVIEDGSGQVKLFVLPSAADRARKVVREIVDARPLG
jgi:hypothetical protein